MNTPDPNLNEAIEEYHRSLQRSGAANVTVGLYAWRDARLIRTDGTILHQQVGLNHITSFWVPFMAKNHKTVIETVTVAIEGNTAYEVCRYHFAISSQRPGIEEGHYLAVWRLEDNQWRIETQAFSSSDRLMLLLASGEIA